MRTPRTRTTRSGRPSSRVTAASSPGRTSRTRPTPSASAPSGRRSPRPRARGCDRATSRRSRSRRPRAAAAASGCTSGGSSASTSGGPTGRSRRTPPTSCCRRRGTCRRHDGAAAAAGRLGRLRARPRADAGVEGALGLRPRLRPQLGGGTHVRERPRALGGRGGGRDRRLGGAGAAVRRSRRPRRPLGRSRLDGARPRQPPLPPGRRPRARAGRGAARMGRGAELRRLLREGRRPQAPRPRHRVGTSCPVDGARSVKSGFVSVAGRPNVGKSTLVNALCGGKVAIVSDKPQTTRRRIFGIANADDYQLVLADLPGFQRPRDELTERMQHTVDTAFEDVEGVLFALSARERIGAGDRFIAQRVFGLGVPVVIALNKVDRLKPGHIAQQMNAAAQLGEFHALHPVSAKTGDGVGELREELVGLLPEGPLYFPQEQRTDLSVETQIAELIREKALWLTRDEVPHAISVEVEELDEKVLRAHLLVETDSQKQILVGKGGAMVRDIGTRARPEIEALLGRTIYLDLVVKVRPRWRRDDALLE